MNLNHLHLIVGDLERSKAFYSQIFGFREKMRYGPNLLFIQNDSGFDLALTPATSVESLPKGVHFGFSVSNRAQLEEFFAKVKQFFPKSLSLSEPSDHGDWGSFSCVDPDGYTVEIYWDSNLHST